MILLDTDVLSEYLRPGLTPMSFGCRNSRALACLPRRSSKVVLYGVRLLPEGARRTTLRSTSHFNDDFAGRVRFDRDAADAYAQLASARRTAGKPISQFDAMIAAIALTRGASLATRNTKDFADCGIVLIDPWMASAK
jgi:hypothetical protein